MKGKRLLTGTLVFCMVTIVPTHGSALEFETLETSDDEASVQLWRIEKALEEANSQLKVTNYEGRETFGQILQSAKAAMEGVKTADDVQKIIDEIHQAQEVYLKNRPSEWITIQNGNKWLLEDGKTSVQAHAPGFVRVGDIWYMCGEDRSAYWNPDVNLYSSIDLVHWKFEKKIIKNGVTTAELGKSRFIERPKLLYNANTDKYVVWCHYEQSNYGASEAACFECDRVNGDYQVVWTGRPLDVKSRDCNVFQDVDGKAYFVSTTNENKDLGLFTLSDDYHHAIEHTAFFKGNGREAPAMVRVGSKYFMLNSACSGWEPNQCKMAYSRRLKSGWSSLVNVGNDIAYDTQAAAILTIKGTKTTTYLYVGDRWKDPELPDTKTIIFPLTFDGSACKFHYCERFDINFVTGEWRETPTDDVFADKTDWKVEDCNSEQVLNGTYNPATYAIDGNPSTYWCTNLTVGGAPYHLTIDMGKLTCIKGFLATPRMDYAHTGLIRNYEFQISEDNVTWTTVVSGSWLLYDTEVSFDQAYQCRYFRIVTKDSPATVGELDVLLDAGVTHVENAKHPMDDQIVSRRYYTLDGRQTNTPQKGIYVEKVLYQNGTSVTRKRYRK